MTAPIPLAEQMSNLDRILDERVRFYRLGAKKQTLALDVAAEKHREVEDIRRSFAFLVANQDWIRAEAKRRAERAAADAEWASEAAAKQRALAEDIAALRGDPATAAVLAEFPDAAITLTEPEPVDA